jgi:hypothetical protein
MEIVAEYQGKPSLDMYAQMLYSAGMEYGKCLLVVENNGIGISVFEKLKDLGYENLYYSVKGTHEFVDASQGEFMNNAIGGFTTSSKTRPLIVAKLEEFIRNRIIKIPSARAFDEFRTFIWNNGKPEAMRSYHDDVVMSLAIVCWVRDTALEVSQKDVEYRKAMIDGMYMRKNTLNTTIKGQEGYDRDFGTKYKEEINIAKSFAWIFKG